MTGSCSSGLHSSEVYLLEGVAKARSFFSLGDIIQVESRIPFSVPLASLRRLQPAWDAGAAPGEAPLPAVPSPATRGRPRAACSAGAGGQGSAGGLGLHRPQSFCHLTTRVAA